MTGKLGDSVHCGSWLVSVWLFCNVLRPEFQNYDRSTRHILIVYGPLEGGVDGTEQAQQTLDAGSSSRSTSVQ